METVNGLNDTIKSDLGRGGLRRQIGIKFSTSWNLYDNLEISSALHNWSLIWGPAGISGEKTQDHENDTLLFEQWALNSSTCLYDSHSNKEISYEQKYVI